MAHGCSTCLLVRGTCQRVRNLERSGFSHSVAWRIAAARAVERRPPGLLSGVPALVSRVAPGVSRVERRARIHSARPGSRQADRSAFRRTTAPLGRRLAPMTAPRPWAVSPIRVPVMGVPVVAGRRPSSPDVCWRRHDQSPREPALHPNGDVEPPPSLLAFTVSRPARIDRSRGSVRRPLAKRDRPP
jgi:hypothetical protein